MQEWNIGEVTNGEALWQPMFDISDDRRGAVFIEGVPAWLAKSLLDWVMPDFADWNNSPDRLALLEAERKLRIQLDWSSDLAAHESFLRLIRSDEDELLAATDMIAAARYERGETDSVDRLGRYLTEAGSAWKVGRRNGHVGLQRRVDATLESQRAALLESGAKDLVDDAWAALYGRSPNFGLAFSAAIKAVESAFLPLVLPNDKKGTLGKVCARLRKFPGTLAVAMDPGEGGDATLSILSMLELLWRSQPDRHGSGRAANELEATGSVHFAITLVHLVQSGVVTAMDRRLMLAVSPMESN